MTSDMALNKITLAAPAQIANIFGFFDHAGVLCRDPPLNDVSRNGGPGDLITIERNLDGSGIVSVEYLLRGCDSDGYWEDVEVFNELTDYLNKNPGKNIIGHLTRATLDKIAEITGVNSMLLDSDIHITVIKHLPNRLVGSGLGSSASSTAIVIGLDYIFGEHLRHHEDESLLRNKYPDYIRLDLMAYGEQIASGSAFYDNVAPLLIKGGLIFIDNKYSRYEFLSMPWPDGLYAVTITPDFSLETYKMRRILDNRMVDVSCAVSAAHRRAEVMRGIYTGDVERIICNSTDSIIEPFRWPLIRGSELILDHIKQLKNNKSLISIGISGSGPTVYCLAASKEDANEIGHAIHSLWKKQSIQSWWFVHEINTCGARIIHS